MASEPEVEGPQTEAQRDDGLQPVHLFVLGGLIAATAAAVLAHGTRPANVIFLAIAAGAAAAMAYAFYRMLWPLVSEEPDTAVMLGGRTRAALERDKALVLRAIKELEFDRAMGKVSEADCRDMTARLRARAVRIIKQLDSGAAGYRELIERELAAREGRGARRVPTPDSVGGQTVPAAETAQPRERAGERRETVGQPGEAAGQAAAAAPAGSTCPQCGAQNDTDAQFCKRCGTKLTVAV